MHPLEGIGPWPHVTDVVVVVAPVTVVVVDADVVVVGTVVVVVVGADVVVVGADVVVVVSGTGEQKPPTQYPEAHSDAPTQVSPLLLSCASAGEIKMDKNTINNSGNNNLPDAPM